jgi:hypothetical protein
MTSIPRFASEAAAVLHSTNNHGFKAGQSGLSVDKILAWSTARMAVWQCFVLANISYH